MWKTRRHARPMARYRKMTKGDEQFLWDTETDQVFKLDDERQEWNQLPADIHMFLKQGYVEEGRTTDKGPEPLGPPLETPERDT